MRLGFGATLLALFIIACGGWWLVSASLIVFVLLIAFLMYIDYDPLGLRPPRWGIFDIKKYINKKSNNKK